MTVFVCVDDHNGMLFNHRRQSRDEAVLKDMLDAAGTDIWMNGYSSKLFRKAPDRVVIEEGFLSLAPGDGYCFVENVPLGQAISKYPVILATMEADLEATYILENEEE